MNKKKILALIVPVLIVAGISVGLLLVFMQPSEGGDGNDPVEPIIGNGFISRWNTTLTSYGSSDTNQIKFPLESSGNYDFSVDWGDGTSDTITSWNQSEVVHTYSLEGVYTINITGQITGWKFNNEGDRLKLLEIKQWCDLKLGNSGKYFYGCENLKITATDMLNLNGTTNLEYAFTYCYNLDTIPNMNQWDVSKVTNMQYMFWVALSFKEDISNWDVSSVTNMREMFCYSSSFNQDISNWNVSNVIDMGGMFGVAEAFNQDIRDWDVSSVTEMNGMFSNARLFNQDIGGWDVSIVTDMESMFAGAQSFNQDIGNWDVSNVEEMRLLFFAASNFHQDIGGWDVSSVTDMSYMFAGASSFDQDLGTWNVSQVINMSGMFNSVTLSTANYDSLLLGWSSLNLQDEVEFSAGNSQCTSPGAPADARQYIVDTFNWTIYDGDGTHNS